MKTGASTVAPGSDFDFSADVSIQSEYEAALYFGDLNPYTATTGTSLLFYIDDYGGGGQSVGFRVYNDGVDSLDEWIRFYGNSGNLRVSRTNGEYDFYFNGTLLWQNDISDLDGMLLNYGVADHISSGPSGYTAQAAFDNLSFTSTPEPSTLVLLGVGAIGLLGYARQRRRNARGLFTACVASLFALAMSSATQAQTFTVLHSFDGTTDGSAGMSTPVLVGSTLYGTTGGGQYGGSPASRVFQVNTDGSGFNVLHTLGPGEGNTWTSLTLGDSTLYGVAASGGTSGTGTVFKLGLDGSNFSVLHSFSILPFRPAGYNLGPFAVPTVSGSYLYGANTSDNSLYKMATDGSDFETLHTFNGLDGTFPAGDLTLVDSTLFGATKCGGTKTPSAQAAELPPQARSSR